MTAEEADILARMTAGRGLPNMVCFSYRFKAAARYMKDIIGKGHIGKIYHVYMQYLQAGGGPEWDLPRSWRYIKELTGTGALGDLGCHALDLVSFVTGKDYVKAVGHADTFTKMRRLEEGEGLGPVDVDDFCNFLMEMEDGVAADFEITRFAYGRGNYQRLEIYGSQGAVVYTLDAKGPGVDEIEACIGPVTGRAGAFTTLPIPDRFRTDQMQSFADILNGVGDGMAASIQEGCRIQHALESIIRSAGEQRWLPV
jgi:predicted dehydrogenase